MLDEFSRLGVAFGLGLLVGLQRERTDSRLAGFRTFPLVTVLGALCGLLGETYGGWIVGGGLAALALIIVGGNLPLLRKGDDPHPGITTEVAMLVMFALGAFVMTGSMAVAIVTCGAVVVLLHLKPEMHSLAKNIGDRDFKAIVRFALISLVILPVLPNQTYGPFQVLNPFKIWLMVVLIVGLSLGGYVAFKVIGARAGAWASGLLGGVISSTATTVSVARQSKQSAGNTAIGVFVIMIASAVSFVRVSILLGATAPRLLQAAVVPLSLMCATLGLLGWWSLHRSDHGTSKLPEPSNPAELKPALFFGAMYGVMLLAVAAANKHFGQQGLYVTAVISGLTDMDAITLSVSQIVNSSGIETKTGWRLIVVAAMANLVFKAAAVAALGDRKLLLRVALGFGAVAGVGVALLVFWPN
jgi:uncharacterized membrane protein (DUF4010 family)